MKNPIQLDVYPNKNKPQLVFFPGWTYPIERETKLFALLKQSYQLASVKLPGYGTPDTKRYIPLDQLVEHIAKAIDKQGFSTAHLAGFSLGSQLVLRYLQITNKHQPSVLIGCPLEPYVPVVPRKLLDNQLLLNTLRGFQPARNMITNKMYQFITENPQAIWPESISRVGGFDSLMLVMTSKPIVDLHTDHVYVYGENDPLLKQAQAHQVKNLHIIPMISHGCMREHEQKIMEILHDSYTLPD